MKKPMRPKSNRKGELPAEVDFDFSKARPNRFAKQLRGKELVVIVESDLARAFPTARAVNEALRKQLAAKVKSKTRKAAS